MLLRYKLARYLTFFPTSASTYMRQSITFSVVLIAQISPRGDGTISLNL